MEQFVLDTIAHWRIHGPDTLVTAAMSWMQGRIAQLEAEAYAAKQERLADAVKQVLSAEYWHSYPQSTPAEGTWVWVTGKKHMRGMEPAIWDGERFTDGAMTVTNVDYWVPIPQPELPDDLVDSKPATVVD